MRDLTELLKPPRDHLTPLERIARQRLIGQAVLTIRRLRRIKKRELVKLGHLERLMVAELQKWR